MLKPLQSLKRVIYFVAFIGVFMFCSSAIYAAVPPNDSCGGALPIIIVGGGFGLGIFTSTNTDMTDATLQTGETFAPSITVAGLTKKSVWYKFSIPTNRSVRVSLLQPGSAIQAGNVGFTIYKTKNCLPGNVDISTKLSPIETFGNTFHPCVDVGDYLVQVTSNNAANGPIYITIETAEPTPAEYDKPVNAYNFIDSKTYKVSVKDYLVQCQTIDNVAENCQPNGSFANYTKSTWQTFTTPNYFEYLNFWLAIKPGNYGTPPVKIGYRLYEGDATTTPVAALLPIGDCDSMLTDLYAIGKKYYGCGELKLNTKYTVQLLFHKDFSEDIRVAVEWNGSQATNGPVPVSSLATPNKIATLNTNATIGGDVNTLTDYFGCNSRHSQNNCPKSMPKDGVLYNGYKYNLSSFFAFNLSTTTSLFFNPINNPCSGQLLLRLYKQSLTSNCADLDTANIIAVFQPYIYQSNPLSCLEAGDYVLQVMGIDSVAGINSLHISSLNTYPENYMCRNMGLGSFFKFNMNARTEVTINKFALNASGKFDKINANGLGVMQPLQRGITYTATPDTLGCANTVLPDDNICKPVYNETYTKASYREFVVADSFILQIPDYISTGKTSKLYKGDANALAVAQNASSFPQKITGLEPYSFCMYGNSSNTQNACIIPGTYTIANFDNRIGYEVTNKFTIIQPRTKHALPAKAQDMGDIWSKIDVSYNMVMSDVDTFTCYDNPATIDGLSPCTGIYSAPATKLIYRQFYLNKPAIVTISSYNSYPYYKNFSGTLSLFSGKATDGLSALKTMGTKWTCFTSAASSGQCDALPAGWYTVVSYGVGPSYSNPLPSNIYDVQYSDVGTENGFFIRLTSGCATPKFNLPYKASIDTVTSKPYLVEWGPQTGHTAAYPVTSKKYVLNMENFDCSQDTLFIGQHMNRCNADNVKVAFYVFKITQESFIQIDGIDNVIWSSVYSFDVRTSDSTKLKTDAPLQPCLNKTGAMEFCRLQPGTYTIVFYAPESYTCNSVTPTIYVDQVGYSRFDHASSAYDFGIIKPDSTWRNGKIGDINPLNSSRAASNDFFYCTTGSREKDPTDATCNTLFNPYTYTSGTNIVLHPDNAVAPSSNIIDRRNLWYTFTVNQPGNIKIKVENKTLDKAYQHLYAVYKSDVDGTLPFTTVVANGQADSTLLDGLTFVGTNLYPWYYYCQGSQEINVYNEPCNFTPTRYYIVVENRNSYYYANAHDMNPNSQVEISVLLDSVNALPPKFDHFSQANDMGLVNSGIKKGAVDNFTCATKDLSDPLNYTYVTGCNKTLWYKFTTTVTGQIRYAAFFKGTNNQYYDNIQLFQQIKPNDSSSTGLLSLIYTSNYFDNGVWAQRCITPGTYYIILPGCNAVNEDVYPQIEIIPQAGDFCSAPMVTGLTGPGNRVVPVTVDCHTIGTDYGEFNPTLTCPANGITSNYKTSWYRLDITGSDTLDVTVYIDEKTNASSTDIKYRMMTGTCGAMQEQSCVQDALTRNTYKCLSPGNSYYIQVFSPTLLNSYTPVTGDIDLNIQAVVHADTCLPASTCIGVANFTPQFDCTKDKNVTFTNFSTYGSSIQYKWDFGYNNQTSTAVSPQFFYPALTIDKTYTVKLVITNTICGKKDSVTQTISIPARPAVNLGNDTVICDNAATVLLDATSHSGSTYYWYNGSTQPTFTASGVVSPNVEVTYNSCKTRDTINIKINPIAKRSLQTKALCAITQVTLDASRGQGELYQWSNGTFTSSITVSQPGIYWVDLYWNGCIVRDSFQVVSTSLRPLGNDTTLCQANMPYTANATVSGATSYTWQNSSSNSTYSITQPGKYWVDINLGGCTFRDSLTVVVDSFKTVVKVARICQGQNYVLPSGRVINLAGNYSDSLKNIRGCDSIITSLTLAVDTVKRVTKIISVCAGQNYILPSGKIITLAGNYIDTVKNSRSCDSIITTLNLSVAVVSRVTANAVICNSKNYLLPSGKFISVTGVYVDTVKAFAGCDSLITTLNLSVLTPTIISSTASICAGQTFTLPTGIIVSTAGVYRDTLRYTNGCDSLIRNVTVTVNAKPTLGTDKSLAICFGNTANLASQYTTTGLTTNWTLGGAVVTTPTEVSTAGTYQLIATNSSSCADTALLALTISPKPVLGADKAANICQGNTADLASQFTTTGLFANWIMAGVAVGNPAAVATSGAYQLIARNTDGCMDTAIFTLTVNAKPSLGIDKSASICLGSNFDLATPFTTTALTTTWKINGTTVTTPSAVNTAGIYQLVATNINGCSDTALLTLSINPKPDLGIDRAAAICSGNSFDVASQFTTTGFTSNWTLSGTVVTSQNVVTTAGVYQLIVTNSSGCKDTALVTLTVNPKPALGADKTISICQGNTADLTAQFTTTGLTTNWTINGTTDANPTAISVAGIYQLIATNSSNCSDTSMVTITVNAKPALGADKTAAICAGNSFDVTSQFTTTGLTANWTLNGVGVTSVNAITTAGIYQLIVTNSSSCKDTAIVTLTVNPKPALGADKTISICQGNTADLSAQFTTTGLTTNWTINGTSVANPTSGNTAGIYQLFATNSNNCADTALVTLTVNPKPNLGADKFIAICAGNAVNLTTQFTTAGFTTNWTSNGLTVINPASVNIAGIYQLIVTSSAGCKDTAVVTITIAPKPNLGTDKAITICAGNVVNLTTQFSTAGFTANWTIGGATVATPTAVTQSGIYRLIATNSDGCRDTALANLTVNPSPALGADKNVSFCTGTSTDLTTLFLTTGLTASWTLNGNIVTTPAVITNAGTYQLVVANSLNCTDTALVSVTINALPVITIADPAPVCSPSTVNLTAAAVTVGSSAGLNYTYWQDATASTSYQTPTAAASGLYFIKGTDANSCTDIAPVNVIVYPMPVANAGRDTVICNLDSAILHGSASNTSIGSLSYLWTPSAGLTNAGATTTIAKPMATTEYTFAATANYGVCSLTATDKILVTMQPPVPAFAGNDTNVVLGLPHQLLASGGISYLWNPSAGLNNPFAQNPLAIISRDTRFTVVATDIAGCKDTASVLLRVYKGITYYMPNAFSPNGDGINEIFRPLAVGVISTDWFRVFNRYGQVMYESSNIQNGWDGTFMGQRQPIGNYIWSIKGKGRDGNVIEMKGNVVLVR